MSAEAAEEAVRVELAAIHGTELDRLDRDLARRTQRLVERTLGDLQRQVTRRGALTPYARHLSEGALRGVREGLEDFERGLDDLVRDGQRRAGALAGESLRRNLRGLGAPTDAFRPTASADLLAGLTKIRVDLIRDLGTDARERIRIAVLRGALVGESPTRVEEAARQALTEAELRRIREREGLAPTVNARARAVAVELESPGVAGRILARAEAIARTEGLTAFSVAWQLGASEAAAVVPGLAKEWDAINDDRARATHLAAERETRRRPIGVDERFEVGQARLLVPRDPTGFAVGPNPAEALASERIQCRCASRLRRLRLS